MTAEVERRSRPRAVLDRLGSLVARALDLLLKAIDSPTVLLLIYPIWVALSRVGSVHLNLAFITMVAAYIAGRRWGPAASLHIALLCLPFTVTWSVEPGLLIAPGGLANIAAIALVFRLGLNPDLPAFLRRRRWALRDTLILCALCVLGNVTLAAFDPELSGLIPEAQASWPFALSIRTATPAHLLPLLFILLGISGARLSGSIIALVTGLLAGFVLSPFWPVPESYEVYLRAFPALWPGTFLHLLFLFAVAIWIRQQGGIWSLFLVGIAAIGGACLFAIGAGFTTDFYPELEGSSALVFDTGVRADFVSPFMVLSGAFFATLFGMGIVNDNLIDKGADIFRPGNRLSLASRRGLTLLVVPALLLGWAIVLEFLFGTFLQPGENLQMELIPGVLTFTPVSSQWQSAQAALLFGQGVIGGLAVTLFARAAQSWPAPRPMMERYQHDRGVLMPVLTAPVVWTGVALSIFTVAYTITAYYVGEEKREEAVGEAAVSTRSAPLKTQTCTPDLASGQIPSASVLTVEFAEDSSQLPSDVIPAVSCFAEWFIQQPQLNLVIEGHADEQGTREYNLALGARRANSMQTALEGYGVPASRINTVTYGMERPSGACEEGCAANRRVVLVLSNS